MKFNSNKLTERIDFCEDISERVKRESSKTKVKVLYSCYACIQEAKESDTQTNLNTGSKFIKLLLSEILEAIINPLTNTTSRTKVKDITLSMLNRIIKTNLIYVCMVR